MAGVVLCSLSSHIEIRTPDLRIGAAQGLVMAEVDQCQRILEGVEHAELDVEA